MKGVRWGYLGMGIGGVASIAANVLHALLPASPPPGSVVAAAFWPVALFVTVEILAKNQWPDGTRWTLLRWGGTLPVAAVTAVVSYRHMSGLLTAWGEDALTATVGPVAVDGLLVMSSGAVIAAGVRAVAAVTVVEDRPLGVTADAQPVSIAVDEPAQPEPAPVAPVPHQSTTVPDGELDCIIRAALEANPKAGFPTVAQVIKDAGWLVGNTERVKDALRAQKQPGLRVVAGSGS